MPGASQLLSPKMEEFYESGLINIINVIPRDFPKADRLFIEAVTYTGYGFFRSYRQLENLLNEIIGTDGIVAEMTPARNRDIFTCAWQCVDAAYALLQLSMTPPAKRFPITNNEVRDALAMASSLRNYMDHLKANFGNIANSTGWFPVFGWLTCQYSPHFKDSTLPRNVSYIVNLGSTHIDGSININAMDHFKASVFSYIDNVTLHARKKDSINLSALLIDMALSLNDFSMKTQLHLAHHLENYTGDAGGVRVGWSRLTVRADLHDVEMDESRIEYLTDYKVRIELHPNDQP